MKYNFGKSAGFLILSPPPPAEEEGPESDDEEEEDDNDVRPHDKHQCAGVFHHHIKCLFTN